MRDTLAEAVAMQLGEMVAELEGHGLRRSSIIEGVRLGLERLKSPAEREAHGSTKRDYP